MVSIKVLICTHKEVNLPSHEYFFPIQAGSALSEKRMIYANDDIGENISIKNRNYCELTCHYWAWKNLKDVEIIGLNHYRRYFDFSRKWKFFSPDRSFISVDEFLKKPYFFPDFKRIFNKYDIILGSRRSYPYSISTQYCVAHLVDDWNILREVIFDLSPEYIPAFQKTMDHSNTMSGFNMFITKWKYFDEYSEWLFKIEFEFEKRVKISAYPNQSRIFGYVSERLINVYCEYKNLRIKHIPVLVPIDGYNKKLNPSNLHYVMRKIKNKVAFYIAQL